MWLAISFTCAAYVFLGVIPAVYELYYSHWILGGLFTLVYVGNALLLRFANTKE